MADERTQRRLAQAKKAKRKNRLLLGSTWSLMLAAFAGFFVLWDHLGTSTTQAAVSQSGTTRTDTTRNRDGDSGGSNAWAGSGVSSGYSDGGSASISASQGSDFSSGAS